MSTFNRTTLVKVLEILDSSNAGEALAAAKLASTMVREAGLSWDDVLAPQIQGHGPVETRGDWLLELGHEVGVSSDEVFPRHPQLRLSAELEVQDPELTSGP